MSSAFLESAACTATSQFSGSGLRAESWLRADWSGRVETVSFAPGVSSGAFSWRGLLFFGREEALLVGRFLRVVAAAPWA